MAWGLWLWTFACTAPTAERDLATTDVPVADVPVAGVPVVAHVAGVRLPASPLRLVVQDHAVVLEAAVLRLERASGATIDLVAMVHVADPSFFADVARSTASREWLYLEGLSSEADVPPGPEPDLSALGLVFQSAALPVDTRFRQHDLTVEEVRRRLLDEGTPAALVAAWLDDRDRGALAGLAQRPSDARTRAITRLQVAQGLAAPTSDDPHYLNVLIGARDAVLVASLPPSGDLGVLYGADHWTDLAARFGALGFQPVGVSWNAVIRVSLDELGIGPVQARQLLDR